MFLFICLNLLIDLMPSTIGIMAACKWANNKIEKNKINYQTQFILNLNIKINCNSFEEREIPLANNYNYYRKNERKSRVSCLKISRRPGGPRY